MFKEYFIFKHSNASKDKFSDHCDENGLEEHKVEINEVDTLNKAPPSLDFCKSQCIVIKSIIMLYQIFF